MAGFEVITEVEPNLTALSLTFALASVAHWRKRFEDREAMTCVEARYGFEEMNRVLFRGITTPTVVMLEERLVQQSKDLQQSVMTLRDRGKFLGATDELWWSAHCYRMESFTAAVFHAMRAVEQVMVVVARELNVPHEFEQWQNIIEGIEKAIKDLSNLSKGQKKSEDQEFYSGLAKEFRYFKDAWRNHVSHSRRVYDENKAKEVCFHVRDFILHASEKLDEQKNQQAT